MPRQSFGSWKLSPQKLHKMLRHRGSHMHGNRPSGSSASSADPFLLPGALAVTIESIGDCRFLNLVEPYLGSGLKFEKHQDRCRPNMKNIIIWIMSISYSDSQNYISDQWADDEKLATKTEGRSLKVCDSVFSFTGLVGWNAALAHPLLCLFTFGSSAMAVAANGFEQMEMLRESGWGKHWS